MNTYFLRDFLFHQSAWSTGEFSVPFVKPWWPLGTTWLDVKTVQVSPYRWDEQPYFLIRKIWENMAVGGIKSLTKNRCSPHANAKIPTLLPAVAIFNLTKLSLMVTWYLIMDNRVEMAPIILWFWLKPNFSPTTGGDYNECNIISWTFDQTATCILVTWLVYIESELHWIVNAPLSPDQRDHRAGSQLKNDITCANHARRISEIRVDKNVNDFFWTEATTETDQMES